MHFVGALFIKDLLLVLIFRIFVALFEGMVALQPMQVEGLKSLVVTLGGTLVVLLVVEFEVVVVTVAIVMILWFVAPMLPMMTSAAMIIYSLFSFSVC